MGKKKDKEIVKKTQNEQVQKEKEGKKAIIKGEVTIKGTDPINIILPIAIKTTTAAILEYMKHGVVPIYTTSEEEVYEVIRSPTKKEILELCFESEKTITELAQSLGKSMSTISSHVSDLQKMGLIGTRTEGGNRYVKTLFYPLTLSDDHRMLIESLLLNNKLEDGRTLLDYFGDVVFNHIIEGLFLQDSLFRQSVDVLSENVLYGFDAAFLYLMRRILEKTYEKINELIIYSPFIEAARKGHDFENVWKEWIIAYRKFIEIRGKYLPIVSMPDDELRKIAEAIYGLFKE